MKLSHIQMERRIRMSGLLVIAGLFVELITLHWSHPTAFLFFMFLGATLIGLGILIFLISLVEGETTSSE